jgi:UTP--glucose-1-phosphate uridylyltransferase
VQQRIHTAVIPAAGLGTRMLPETKAVPKELLPVGGKPAIQWALDEAREAGIDRFVVVSSRHKPAIAAYLLGPNCASDPFCGRARPDRADLSNSNIEIVYQPFALGLGDAVRIARSVVGSEPFALLLPDEILLGGARLLRTMIDDFTFTGRSGVSLLHVDRADIGSYGCAAVAPIPENLERFLVTACVEKPQPFEAPSSFALSGRYVLAPEVLDLLDSLEPDEHGEVQITEALDRAARATALVGFEVRKQDGRVDVGNWPGWLDANIRAFAIAG